MRRLVLVGLAAGVAFLVLDGLLNANPLAQQVYAVYRPMARSSVNAIAGSLVDLAYGLKGAIHLSQAAPSSCASSTMRL